MKDKEKQVTEITEKAVRKNEDNSGAMVDLLNQEQEELKKAMIEEMAEIIFSSKYKNDYISPLKGANELYNAGYRKLPEDSVVLSRGEYKRLLDNAIRVDMEYLDHERAKERKETAEKFLQLAYDRCLEKSFIKKVEELAKELEIEIKE